MGLWMKLLTISVLQKYTHKTFSEFSLPIFLYFLKYLLFKTRHGGTPII